jgi:hypothetical protein
MKICMSSFDQRKCGWKDNIKICVKEMGLRVWREALAALKAGVMQFKAPGHCKCRREDNINMGIK